MRIVYTEALLSSVLQYFADGFSPQGARIVGHEAIVDTAKDRVVFKVFLEDDTPAAEKAVGAEEGG